VTIRPAVAANLPAIRALDAEVFGADAWGEAGWQGEWEQVPATRRLVVAAENEQVVGYAVLAIVGEVSDLHRIGVAAPHRRHGLGALLLEAVLAEASVSGCDRILLEVEDGNAPALALYDRFGFVEIARREAYYGPGRAALVLERALP
jgi:[ribosomal protein S18]-alanine N-acetyltransferase